MKVSVISLFPEMFQAITQYGVTGRAIKSGLVEVDFFNPRDFTHDKHKTVDDRPYGGGPGMLMKVQPLKDAIASAKLLVPNAKVIYLSPQGRTLTQEGVQQLAKQAEFILVAGRYEGVDERLIQSEIDEEWSIGDFVLSGGELPAMVLMDAVFRMVPGVLGKQASADEDSFSDGLLDCPHYTRPEVLNGEPVPSVLLSGNHEEIRRWRLKQKLARTFQRRPDLLQNLELDKEQQLLLEEFIRETEDSTSAE
ncbi:MAG: tRNA (guanosine(37)-N1)-methyltransferase TrmD [Gammaproteobacteria bacterium]|uniref:tRNA (guanosine(37)-N1)-methyltransferase TrmD n=1 Tax=unclassified Marinomonas TaxID=196814 RepID=UPI000C1F7B94|nr:MULTISPECIES: tRNA (guanosine(37)-N1)-methyltransferase TrmD [unclassified Marinomonas]MBU1296890.1 tRNA (guanosine(37)-N1)-methyltransferase TrmD [Gammaproteobacteria bacterium]MBU1467424.1 tRNA (guanosine(37)-N1)-methyltransferase TrmD [Gammaproteobacteria bacterium]MBU2320948.1 tRNA (guanosine(37)-N1)-methyltransferase TrmD [Gammaproteobacteria bacterium]MBU2413848.1 tRNA (guanosine(37)-N1)-methyltransferase TrmD [Gammaproteobacteria bacterium]PJE54685.1 tRNA (guanine-N1)-methyltransfera